MISALPDIKHVKVTAEDEFMILACDGIWNSMSSEEVVEFVRERIVNGDTKISAICEEVSGRQLWHLFILHMQISQLLHHIFYLAFHQMLGTEYIWRWHWLRQHDRCYCSI